MIAGMHEKYFGNFKNSCNHALMQPCRFDSIKEVLFIQNF